jgi:hypothetical protein
MSATDDKKQLFENLLLLRRATRELPMSKDLAAVRVSLEGQLGQTVSRRMAGDLLGVSHTALGRWISAGDVPTVFTPGGRTEIPVGALLDLRELVDDERRNGNRSRHVLEPVMMRARIRAERIRPENLLSDVEDGDGHRPAELRGLAYHRTVAEQLRRSNVDDARQLIWKWREQGRIDQRYADQWEALLVEPLGEIRRALSEDSPRMRDLRQNSPFAGVLSEVERRRVLEAVP